MFGVVHKRNALVAEWYTQQLEGLCREAWWFESTRGHRDLASEKETDRMLFLTYRHKNGRLAQLVRAVALHAIGLGFESLIAH